MGSGSGTWAQLPRLGFGSAGAPKPLKKKIWGGGGFGPAAARVLLLRGTTARFHARFHCNILRRNTFPERGTDTAAEVLCCL